MLGNLPFLCSSLTCVSEDSAEFVTAYFFRATFDAPRRDRIGEDTNGSLLAFFTQRDRSTCANALQQMATLLTGVHASRHGRAVLAIGAVKAIGEAMEWTFVAARAQAPHVDVLNSCISFEF